MSFQTISEEGWPEYEIWTCDTCGYSLSLNGTGGDIAECPECIRQEYAREAEEEQEYQTEDAEYPIYLEGCD